MGGPYKWFGVCCRVEFNCLTYKNMRTTTARSVEGLGYLLAPWSRDLLEKLTGLQLVKFPAFYATRSFILILSPHLRLDLPSGLFQRD